MAAQGPPRDQGPAGLMEMRAQRQATRTYHKGCEQSAAVVWIEDADKSQGKNGNSHGQNLCACPNTSCKEVEIRWWPEHITMDVLPASLLLLLSCNDSHMS